jgi:hypothetical protein
LNYFEINFNVSFKRNLRQDEIKYITTFVRELFLQYSFRVPGLITLIILNYFKLPCKSTLSKYFGTGNDNLIKHRLMCEIKTLRASEKVCSLVVDDMAVRESISYSKAEDRIFGLETINQSQDKIGAKPVIANQLLCFVIYGLSTKYIIPASYFFHRQLTGKDLYKLTLEVLKMLSECGFFCY